MMPFHLGDIWNLLSTLETVVVILDIHNSVLAPGMIFYFDAQLLPMKLLPKSKQIFLIRATGTGRRSSGSATFVCQLIAVVRAPEKGLACWRRRALRTTALLTSPLSTSIRHCFI